ncbi:hypothetical protein AFV7_gp42 [Betalipothrixvirus pezzuloense]|uniref:Uncharacterized protein n=1 Tax=Betalipothrixvirus pezzuloense TaxID=346883 RepID=A7WKQ9_9VIRU|nr:hypothetical protein AFV7_gp42 [Acidianus filamentous virus 7]CAJ31662.1 conserved hypothetical protein [Acidianus filamentous virus 7]
MRVFNLNFHFIIMDLQELLASPKKKDLKRIKVKVYGFVIVRKVKPELKTEKLVAVVRNQITGLSNLLYGLAGATQNVQTSSYPPGVVLYNSAGQVITNLPLANVGTNPTSTGATVIFQVYDSSANSYTATQLQLISEAGGKATPVATTTMTITKSADEWLYINWLLVFCVVENPENIVIVPSISPGGDFQNCVSSSLCCPSACGQTVVKSNANSQPSGCVGGQVGQYMGQNLITSLIFSLIAYSTSSISYAYPGNNALGIAVSICCGVCATGACNSSPQDVSLSSMTVTIGKCGWVVYTTVTCANGSSSSNYIWSSNLSASYPSVFIIANVTATVQGCPQVYVGVLIEFQT